MRSNVICSRADSAELKRAALAIEQSAWNQLGYLNYTRAHFEYYDDLLEEYADYQLCLMDADGRYPVAVACCVPLRWDSDHLPEEGWDWLVETAASRRDQPANYLGALAISVPNVHRGKGYARDMIRAMHELAIRRSLKGVIAPVRPSAKALHPFVPIKDYVGWSDEAGRIYDPWLRSHVSAGGRIVGPCRRSMVVEEPIAFWETWAGRSVDPAQTLTIDGGLVPVDIDLDRGIGRYEEPNIWVAYAH